MAAEGDFRVVEFIFNGENRDDIPRNVTHLYVHKDITVIPAGLFIKHPTLVEVRCHDGVLKIESWAFGCCPSLRRVIIRGVKIVKGWAFQGCPSLVAVECDKLERIGSNAFLNCKSLSSINLLSVKIVEGSAFGRCTSLSHVIFGKDLESFERGRWYYHTVAFLNCTSLESITIPLKNGLLPWDYTFVGCSNLKEVELVEGGALRDFADALLLESWRSDLKAVIDSINQTLPNTEPSPPQDNGEKAIAVREWIGSVLRKIIHYKATHNKLLKEATAALQLFLPDDMVMNNVLPFIKLPAHKFDGEIDDGDESTNSDISNRGDSQESNDSNEGDAEE